MTIDKIFITPAVAAGACNPITTFYWENATAAVPLIVPNLIYNNAAAAACAPQYTGFIVGGGLPLVP